MLSNIRADVIDRLGAGPTRVELVRRGWLDGRADQVLRRGSIIWCACLLVVALVSRALVLGRELLLDLPRAACRSPRIACRVRAISV